MREILSTIKIVEFKKFYTTDCVKSLLDILKLF